MTRVLMYPHVDDLQPNPTAGISRVVKKYFEHLPDFGIEMAAKGSDAVDLVAIHAASVSEPPHDIPLVSHCHGLYFTADTIMDRWTHAVNQSVIEVVRHASSVSVPSNWVAEIFKRDMHLNPLVIPHGVDWEEWQGGEDLGYVLWNKNRNSDACDPTPVNELAMRAPKTRILTTYAAPDPRPNIRITGTVGYTEMRDMVMKCSVYLATTKETFGIGTLEAMAAGKPILGFDYGGTSDLIKHGYSGYLAAPDDYDDLARGLEYCQKHAKSLGRNASLVAQHYTWKLSAQQVASQYARTMEMEHDAYEVAVVIPMYNKAATILRAVRSAIAQNFKPAAIIVVNNNSTDDHVEQIRIAQLEALEAGIAFIFANCEAQGVAYARNLGIEIATQTLICCLDADDEILPDFLEQCRLALIGNVSLGIAYTKMEVVNTRGERSVSGWPGVYNFDKTLRSQNQVPTCCVFRRVCWERTGGYRQRYAPGGAGSEDADFWLRIGLLGYGGVLATSEPLFRYYLGGTVTGNPNYREVDWRGDKGWLDSRALPFAATSTPDNGLSHPVRQYDEPVVSVIIPVGPGHVQAMIDAIDSVEGQTFRQWELIVVDDGGTSAKNDLRVWERFKDAFPYVRWLSTPNAPRGAGYARNMGATIAKAPFLLFLDADDWLKPTALEDMIGAYNEHPESIIYSDYIGHAYITDQLVLARLKTADRLIEYNEKTTEAIVLYSAFDFDCERAQRQPEIGRDPYIWSVVSSLVPTAWHREIGGFDESMESWEDYDYWVHLAKRGHCFHRVAKPLLEYRFFTGKRRTLANPYESGESGRQLSTHLLEYMRTKYERMENMPCSTCGGGRRSSPPPILMSVHSKSEETMATASSNDMVDVELIDGNLGDHLISFSGQSYGYRASGDKFKMLLAHAKLDRRVRILEAQSAPAASKRRATAAPPPPPDGGDSEPPLVDPLRELADSGDKTPPDVTIRTADAFDLTTLWGINAERAETLKKMGVRSPNGVANLPQAQLMKLFNMAELTARRVISEAQKAVDEVEAAESKSRV